MALIICAILCCTRTHIKFAHNCSYKLSLSRHSLFCVRAPSSFRSLPPAPAHRQVQQENLSLRAKVENLQTTLKKIVQGGGNGTVSGTWGGGGQAPQDGGVWGNGGKFCVLVWFCVRLQLPPSLGSLSSSFRLSLTLLCAHPLTGSLARFGSLVHMCSFHLLCLSLSLSFLTHAHTHTRP